MYNGAKYGSLFSRLFEIADGGGMEGGGEHELQKIANVIKRKISAKIHLVQTGKFQIGQTFPHSRFSRLQVSFKY